MMAINNSVVSISTNLFVRFPNEDIYVNASYNSCREGLTAYRIGYIDYNSAEKSKTKIAINNNATSSPINNEIPEQIIPAQAKMLFVFFLCNANMLRARESPPIKIEKKGIQEKHREMSPVTIEAMLSG